jgi:CheY-like chemotaxis protein
MEKKILVIDDDAGCRAVFNAILTRAGYVVVEAASGSDAIPIIQQERFDLILSDIRMPDGNGIDLLTWLRAGGDIETPFILTSGLPDLSCEDTYHIGAESVLIKPIRVNTLLEITKRLTLPLNQRIRFEDTVTTTLEPLLIESASTELLPTGKLAIGRGGFFVGISDQRAIPLEYLNFKVLSPTKEPMLTGVGVVRWVRQEQNNGLMSGLGVEFANLDSLSLQRMTAFINECKPIPFIPRGELPNHPE